MWVLFFFPREIESGPVVRHSPDSIEMKDCRLRQDANWASKCQKHCCSLRKQFIAQRACTRKLLQSNSINPRGLFWGGTSVDRYDHPGGNANHPRRFHHTLATAKSANGAARLRAVSRDVQPTLPVELQSKHHRRLSHPRSFFCSAWREFSDFLMMVRVLRAVRRQLPELLCTVRNEE